MSAKVNPAIVNITSTLSGVGEAAGTGMVITSSGEVLTNNHVIDGATSISVEIGANGSEHSATVLGYDRADDIALLKVDGVSGLKTITAGDPSKVAVNDPVAVIGNALGRGGPPTVSQGVVAALHRRAEIVVVAALDRTDVQSTPDAQRNALRHRIGERLLKRERGIDRTSGIVEHRVYAIARGLDQAASVAREARLEQVALDPLELGIGGFLRALHQRRVTDHVSGQDCR